MSGLCLAWADIAQRNPIWLNLGGKSHGDPHPEYRGYVSVDMTEGNCLHIVHDLREPIPLPNDSVERIHTEDFLHYLTRTDMEKVLKECYRLLKPKGLLRISLPDYGNPKDRQYFRKGTDDRHPRHLLLTDKTLLEDILTASPFTQIEFYHYWEGDTFVEKPFDEHLGTIQRTPEKEPRNHSANWRWKIRNVLFRMKHGFIVPEAKKPFLRGNRLHITSLIVDCIKD